MQEINLALMGAADVLETAGGKCELSLG